MIKTALILAGGFGTRLRSEVSDLPKPMAPIAGRPFLEYQMDFCINQGVTKFYLSVGYLKDKIINYFGSSYKTAEIVYLIEDRPLGTGGAILNSLDSIDQTFFLLNGDTFFDINLLDFFNFHQARKSLFSMALFKTSNTKRYMGIKLDKNNKILSCHEESKNQDILANGGIYIVNKDIFDNFKINENKISLEDDILPKIVRKESRVYGLSFTKFFIDIGLPEDYKKAKTLFKN